MLDFQNIIDSNGISIAITGMLIVFAALSLISLFIAMLPHLLNSIADFLPPEKDETVKPAPSAVSNDDQALVAAVAFVLHKRRQGKA